MQYMDVKFFSKLWGISERRITTLCRTNRISGAVKEQGIWKIPYDTQKPTDHRRNQYSTSTLQTVQNLPLPIGVSDFKEMISHYYYIDKTLLIKELIDARHKVSLFTRPRRFGKTVTMSMLKTFFEKTTEDTSIYFKNTNIWASGTKYQDYQGKYPIIFLTFKDVKYETWDETLEDIRHLLQEEFDRHSHILNHPNISTYEKNFFNTILSGNPTSVELTGSLAYLSKVLHKCYGQSTIIIIDEYDTPIQQGYMSNYYNEIILFMRNLFSGAFKDNSHLEFGFLTGILRVSKESIFSGLNNMKVNSIFEERYSEYFGFTKNEILTTLDYYNCIENYNEICDWYDGYRFGNTEIFNPWSVLNYLDEKCHPKAFWQSTGDNSIIRQIVSQANAETSENLQCLMAGKTISTYVDTSVIYPEIFNNSSSIYSFLLAAGYLKATKQTMIANGSVICEVAIPNKEIFNVYEKEILSALSNVISHSSAIAIQQAIMQQNISELQKQLENFLVQTISYFDYSHETFYHGLMLGICAIMNNHYFVSSNRESGYGRYDIQLKPRKKQLPGIIIELKVVMEKINEQQLPDLLSQAAQNALLQIENNHYISEMQQEGIAQCMKIGIAFHKKHVKLLCNLDTISS